jgi:hypothetical protein
LISKIIFAIILALPLLMLGISADYSDDAMPFDNSAFFASRFD